MINLLRGASAGSLPIRRPPGPHGARLQHRLPGDLSSARHRARSASLRAALLLAMPLLPVARMAGQALPAAVASPVSTGFALPTASGSLRYSIGVGESISDGYYGSGYTSQTGVNGSLAFISPSQIDPFSMVLSGGDAWGNSGVPSSYFLTFGLSQVISTRHWNLILADSVGYLPQTPSVGLSGVPGNGDIGVAPIQLGDNTQGILTNYSARVSNSASAGAGLHLTAQTSLQFSGSYGILDFIQPVGGEFNSTSLAGGVGLSHRIDARNSISANYGYSEFNYGAGQPAIASQSATGQFSHQFTRRFGVSVSAGPQWSSYSSLVPPQPSSTNLFVAAGANYSGQLTSYSLSYARGTNAGSGVVLGARSDTVAFRVSRTFARVWNTSGTASYARTSALQNSIAAQGFAPETALAAAQISRALGRSFSVFGSYTVENQTDLGAAAASAVFNGLYKIASFGLTFSPSPMHFGPR